MKLVGCLKLGKFFKCTHDSTFDQCPLSPNEKRLCTECTSNTLIKNISNNEPLKLGSFIVYIGNERKRININGLIDYFALAEIVKIFKIDAYPSFIQKILFHCKWSKLAFIGNIKILQSAYIFLVTIPILNFFHLANSYNKLSYLAALFISLSHAGFNYYCPSIFKEFKTSNQFASKIYDAKFIPGGIDSQSATQIWAIADIVHPKIRIPILVGYVSGFLMLISMQIRNIIHVFFS